MNNSIILSMSSKILILFVHISVSFKMAHKARASHETERTLESIEVLPSVTLRKL